MHKNAPLISVIMNCFNGEKFLREAVESVINQSYVNWEIIFWDNQSTDTSAEIINSFDDERIRYYFAPEHTNLGTARNLAVEKASGEWIAFLDCDDLWLESKLFNQVELLRNADSDVALIYGRMLPLIESSGQSSLLGKRAEKNKTHFLEVALPQGHVMPDLLKECFIPLPAAIVQIKAYKIVGGINNHYRVAEDYDLFLKIADKYLVLAIDEVCCVYRIHGSNLSHQNYRQTFDESIELVGSYSQSMPNTVNEALRLWYGRYFVAALRSRDWSRFKDLKLFISMVISIPSLIVRKVIKSLRARAAN